MVNRIVLGLVLIALVSCFDKAYRPKLRNELDTEILVRVTYANGEVVASKWGLCKTVFVGWSDRASQSIKSIEVYSLSDELVYQLSEIEVAEMLGLEQASAGKYSVWVFGKEKIWFSEKDETDMCKFGKLKEYKITGVRIE